MPNTAIKSKPKKSKTPKGKGKSIIATLTGAAMLLESLQTWMKSC